MRALYHGYAGPLYQVKRGSDKATQDIGVLGDASGFADSASQDAFCAGESGWGSCVIQRIYDQSPRANHLDVAPGGGEVPTPDFGADATKARLAVGGGQHAVYAAFFGGGNGYRNDNTTGVAVGDEPETIYMVTSGTHYNDECCFDYGNAETNNLNDGPATMEAVYFGAAKWGQNHGGDGPGPWIMADLEAGLWGADVIASHEPTIAHAFVTAMVKGDAGNHFAIKGGSAQAGALRTYWDGVRPTGDAPMKKQGAIILGIGGDNSNTAIGTFYEGCMTQGFSTNATDDALQANIVAAYSNATEVRVTANFSI